jgi:hypothetical protein
VFFPKLCVVALVASGGRLSSYTITVGLISDLIKR